MKNIIDLLGNTPIVELTPQFNTKAQVHLKLEGYNPTGSVKDRIAFHMIQDKLKSSKLLPHHTLLGASGGSFGCSLVYFGRLLGYPVTVVANDKMESDKRDFIEFFGGEILNIPGSTIDGNNYCAEVLVPENLDKYCFIDQFHDPSNLETHFRYTGPEIYQQIPDLSAIAFSMGTCGTIYGVSKYLKSKIPNLVTIAVDAKSGTNMSGLYSFVDGDYKTPFYTEFIKSNLINYRISVDIDEAFQGISMLRSQGMYTGVCTGAIYFAVNSLLSNSSLTGKILVISGDAGWKNTIALSRLQSD